jgi:FtsZ-binding cell division protein ZapB
LKSLELGNIQFLEIEIEKMKTKVNSMEKKLLDEQNKNKVLLNENKILNTLYDPIKMKTNF